MTATRPEPTVTGDPTLPIGTADPLEADPLEAPARVEVRTDADGRTVLTVLGPACRGLPAMLSRALHAVLDELDCPDAGDTAAAAPFPGGTTVLIDLGRLDRGALDVDRVLGCAEQRAHLCGVRLQVLPAG